MDIFKFEVELDIMLIFKPDKQLLHEEKIKGCFIKFQYTYSIQSDNKIMTEPNFRGTI